MIRGIGTDIVKTARMNAKFAKRILSEEERALFDTFAAESRKQEFLAGRFAAKEALTKALASTEHFFAFCDMTILNDENGRPYLAKPKISGCNTWLSISHERDYAIAFCILEDA